MAESRKAGNRGLRFLLRFLPCLVGISALAGAWMLWSDPSGKAWMLDGILQILREKMPFPGIFFSDFIPSGIVLLLVNGLPQLFAAHLALRGRPAAPLAVMMAGIILMCWIILEWCLLGFLGICNVFFLLGVLEMVTGLYARKEAPKSKERTGTVL